MRERIDIKPLSLPTQKIIEVKEFSLELHETYIYWKEKFLADEEDEIEGWQNVINDIEIIVLKKNISTIEKNYQPKYKAWKVSILIIGCQYDIYVYIKSKVEAEDLFRKLFDYITT